MEVNIVYISEVRNLKLVKNSLNKSSLVGMDTETYGAKKDDGLDPLVGKIRLLQIDTHDKTYVLDMQRLPKGAVREFLAPLMYDSKTVKIFHNAKFDLKFLTTYFDLDLRQMRSIFCTYVGTRLVKGGHPLPNRQQYPAKLSNLSLDYLDLSLDKSNQLYDWGGNIYKEQIVYSALDAAVLPPLYRVVCDGIVYNHLQTAALLEMNVVPVVARQELVGIKLDKKVWQDLAERDKEQLYLIEQELRNKYGFGDVNMNSNPQMCKMLSDITGLHVTSRSKDNIAVLIEMYEDKADLFGKRRDYRPALQKYLEYADFGKDVSTYGFSFLNHIHPVTGRIHSNFRQNDTNTQRFSSSSPNLQNIPRDSDRRAAFIPGDGKKFVRFDYSAIELRILAQFTKDELFCRAFADRIDPHRLNAATQYGIPFDEVTDKQRQDIKPINFGVPYGLGKDGLAQKLGIEVEDAAGRLRKYYDDHPWITDWHNSQFRYMKLYDCVRTPTGRLRAVPNWRADTQSEFEAKQAAKNFPIQSACADIVKIAMVRIFHKLPEAELVISVHDECMYEVDEKTADDLAPAIKEEMRLAAKEVVPDIDIELEGGVAECWKK